MRKRHIKASIQARHTGWTRVARTAGSRKLRRRLRQWRRVGRQIDRELQNKYELRVTVLAEIQAYRPRNETEAGALVEYSQRLRVLIAEHEQHLYRKAERARFMADVMRLMPKAKPGTTWTLKPDTATKEDE